jgi:hypothetical protein
VVPVKRRNQFFRSDLERTTGTKPAPDKGTTHIGGLEAYYILPC